MADFGIARLRHSTFVETKHLNAGTVAYMSPEIMQVSFRTAQKNSFALLTMTSNDPLPPSISPQGKNVDEKCDVVSHTPSP